MRETPLPIIALLVIIILSGITLLLIIALTRGKAKRLDRVKYRADWLAIENDLDNHNMATYQFAILSADKLFDRALQESGYDGTTTAERIKSAERDLRNSKAVWAAHKLRNRIAHEVDTKINLKVLKQMLNVYKNALKSIGAI